MIFWPQFSDSSNLPGFIFPWTTGRSWHIFSLNCCWPLLSKHLHICIPPHMPGPSNTFPVLSDLMMWCLDRRYLIDIGLSKGTGVLHHAHPAQTNPLAQIQQSSSEKQQKRSAFEGWASFIRQICTKHVSWYVTPSSSYVSNENKRCSPGGADF